MQTVLMTADASTMSGLLSLAGEVVTWLITQMTAYLKFMTDNPIILIGIIMGFVGLGVGMLSRIFRSV